MNFKKEEFTLSNGIPVIYSYDDSNDLLAFNAFFNIGSINETKKNQGIRNVCAQMLDKGASGLKREEIAGSLESIGALYSASAGEDYTSFGLSVSKEYSEKGLGIFSKVLSSPDFPQDEFEKEKFLILQSIKTKDEDIYGTCEDMFMEGLFGRDNPYGRDAAGSLKTVGSLSAGSVREFYEKYFIRESLFLVVVGKLSKDEAKEKLEKYFSGYRSGLPSVRAYAREAFGKNKKKAAKKNFFQAFIIIGSKMPPVSSPDYFALKLVSSALGANMSSRFFRILREENALAYAVGTGYPTRLNESYFFTYLGLDKKNIDFASKKIFEELSRLKKDGLTTDEIKDYKAFMKSSLLFSYQSKSARAWYFGFWKAAGCPLDFDLKYASRVDAISSEDIKRAISLIADSNTMESTIIPKK